MSNKPTLLAQAKNIPVPEPGTGEVVVLSSVELLCTWMKLNDLKFKQWRGGLLVVTTAEPQAEAQGE